MVNLRAEAKTEFLLRRMILLHRCVFGAESTDFGTQKLGFSNGAADRKRAV